jgi:hypothetical protein
MAADADLILALLKRGADPTVAAHPAGPERDGRVNRTALDICLRSGRPGAKACATILRRAVHDAERARLLLKARGLTEAASVVARVKAAALATPNLQPLFPPNPLPALGMGIEVPPHLERAAAAAPPCLRYRVEMELPLPSVEVTPEAVDVRVLEEGEGEEEEEAQGAGAGVEQQPEQQQQQQQQQQPPPQQQPQEAAAAAAVVVAAMDVQGEEVGEVAVEVAPQPQPAPAPMTAEEEAYAREQLGAVAAYVAGTNEGQGPRLLYELFIELMEMAVPEWDRDNC